MTLQELIKQLLLKERTIAGQVIINTYRNPRWNTILYQLMVKLSSTLFTQELPEMPKYLLGEPDAMYSKTPTVEEALKLSDYWRDKYLNLLEKYNQLIEEKMTK